MCREYLSTFGGDAVAAATSLPGRFDPSTLEAASFLHAIESRVERSDVKSEGSLGTLVDQFAYFISVAWLVLEQCQEQVSALPFLTAEPSIC